MFLGGLGHSKTSEKRMLWGQYKLTVVPFVEVVLLELISKCIKTIGKSILKSDLCREVYYNISLAILTIGGFMRKYIAISCLCVC